MTSVFKQKLTLIVMIILVLGLFAVLYLVRQQQIFKPRAAVQGGVAFALSPTTATKQVNETFQVNLSIDTKNHDIDGVELTLRYNPGILELVSFQPSTIFNAPEIRKEINNTAGTLRYTGADTSTPRKIINGVNINLGVMTFKGKSIGVSDVTFDIGSAAAAVGVEGGYLAANNTNGRYTIIAGGTPVSPTPTIGGGSNTVSFFLLPASVTKKVNEFLDVTLGINTKGNNIDGVELTLSFNSAILELVSFQPFTVFNAPEIRKEINNTVGTLRYTGADTSTPRKIISGSNINLGTLRFRGKNVGTSDAIFSNSAAASIGVVGGYPGVSNTNGRYTIEAGGTVISPTNVPTQVPTNIPTTAPTSTLAPTQTFVNGTVEFKFAETLPDLEKAPWKPYTTHPAVVNYKFLDKKPGLKFIWVQFKDRNGNISSPDQRSIELVIDPEVLGCSFEQSVDKVNFTILGLNFGGAKGRVLLSDNIMDVSSWKDNQVKSSVPTRLIGPGIGVDEPVNVDLTRADGVSVSALCSDLATSFLSLGAKLFCPQVLPRRIENVELTVVEATRGGQVLKGNVSIDQKGLIEDLFVLLKPGSGYKLGIKVPLGVRQVLEFVAQPGTTNLTDFTHHGKRLALGDIFPLDGGDGKINSLDKSELNREWIVAKDPESPRPGDLNTDNRVNSVDWACMRYDFNKEDEPIPTPGVLTKLNLLTNDIKVSSVEETTESGNVKESR